MDDKLGLYTDELKKLRQQAQHLHRFKTEGVPALGRGHRLGLPHLTKRLSTINTGKGKSSFLKWALATPQDRPHAGQHKNSMVFVGISLHVFVSFHFLF